VHGPDLMQHEGTAAEERTQERIVRASPAAGPSFDDRFTELFEEHFRRLHRFVNRLSGDRELADDLAQETFIRLYRRRSVPERVEAWLITVALNLFRNVRTTRSRRSRLLTVSRGAHAHGDPPPSPGDVVEAGAVRQRVRAAIERLPERERSMLLLHAEGYGYRDIASALELNDASVGTLLARARRAFREAFDDTSHAS